MEAKIDGVLSRMEIAAEKVELYCSSKVKLPMAELDYLKTLEDARDFMTMMVTKTSDNRQQLADVFGGDCSRIARIRTVLDGVVLSDMNCNDQRVRTCTEACATIEKVLEDMGLGWCLKKACDEQKANLGRRRSSLDREAALAMAQAAQAAEAQSQQAEVAPVAPSPAKVSTAADQWAQYIDEDFVKRVLACTEATELHDLEKEAMACKSSKIGNWMIWMVHRAHLDDATLVKFDFTNLKMPEGNVEALISPKLAVAMESNKHIEQLLLGCSNLQDPEAAILAVSLRSNSSLKVLNIDTNAIQPLTLESIAKGTSVNQALQELRCNNTASGRLVTEAFLHALKSNPMMCKLGYPVTDAYFRGEIDKQLTRNNDAARKRRLEEKRRKEAEAEALGDSPSHQSPSAKAYPKVSAKANASWPPKAPAVSEAVPETAQPETKPEAKEVAEVAEATAVTDTEAEKDVDAQSSPKAPEAALAEAAEATALMDTEAEKDVDTQSSPKAPEPEKAEPASETGKAEKEIGTCQEETKVSESLDDGSEPTKTTQTIESFLAEPLDALPGMVDGTHGVSAKADFRGYLYKKSPATLRMKAWDWRFFVIHGRRLVWWRRDRDVPETAEDLMHPDPSGCKGFIDFALSRARVVPDEKNPTLFMLEAVDGAWKDGSLKDMSDAQRTFEFDCADSAHTRGQWIAALCKLQE
ncbi:Tmod2 [Symbiodinium sp. CCMP2456]|nr:Tmod2 [Symbiodinium sp. CCMP2456]